MGLSGINIALLAKLFFIGNWPKNVIRLEPRRRGREGERKKLSKFDTLFVKLPIFLLPEKKPTKQAKNSVGSTEYGEARKRAQKRVLAPRAEIFSTQQVMRISVNAGTSLKLFFLLSLLRSENRIGASEQFPIRKTGKPDRDRNLMSFPPCLFVGL